MFFCVLEKNKPWLYSVLFLVVTFWALVSSSSVFIYLALVIMASCIQYRKKIGEKKLLFFFFFTVLLLGFSYYSENRTTLGYDFLGFKYQSLFYVFKDNPILMDPYLTLSFILAILAYIFFSSRDKKRYLALIICPVVFFIEGPFLSQMSILNEYSPRYLKYLLVCIPLNFFFIVHCIFSLKQQLLRRIMFGFCGALAVVCIFFFSFPGLHLNHKWKRLVLGKAANYYSFLFISNQDYLMPEIKTELDNMKLETYVYEAEGNRFYLKAFKYYIPLKYRGKLPAKVHVGEKYLEDEQLNNVQLNVKEIYENKESERIDFIFSISLDKELLQNDPQSIFQLEMKEVLQEYFGIENIVLLGTKIISSLDADHFILQVRFKPQLPEYAISNGDITLFAGINFKIYYQGEAVASKAGAFSTQLKYKGKIYEEDAFEWDIRKQGKDRLSIRMFNPELPFEQIFYLKIKDSNELEWTAGIKGENVDSIEGWSISWCMNEAYDTWKTLFYSGTMSDIKEGKVVLDKGYAGLCTRKNSNLAQLLFSSAEGFFHFKVIGEIPIIVQELSLDKIKRRGKETISMLFLDKKQMEEMLDTEKRAIIRELGTGVSAQ